jgi:hypothetical protein
VVVKHFAGSPLRVTLDAMFDRPDNSNALPGRYAATAGAALLALTISTGVARPQAAPSPQPSPPSTLGVQAPASQAPPDQAAPQPGEPAPAAPAEANPGLFNEMGKLLEKSLSVLPAMKSPSETIDDLNARAKDVGETMSRLARPASMVTGRIECPVAGNGAPDCKAATDKLCQTKGFKEGKSLTTDSAEKCPAKVYMPGYKRKPDDCRTRNYVTRALCQ